MPQHSRTARGAERGRLIGLGAFFAVMYFLQSLGDPGSGIIAQPVRALLKSWDRGPAEIALFMGVVGLPWACKPVFGLLSDFVPLFGSRRRIYLILATASSLLGFAILAGLPLLGGDSGLLLALLLLPGVGVAFGDVLIDGLMVDEGQPRGLTGVLQSVQWSAAYAALMLTGLIGGYFSHIERPDLAFALCALLWGVSLALAVLVARDPLNVRILHVSDLPATLRSVLGTAGLVPVCGILFIWSFNPLWMSVLYVHLTDALALSELAYGRIQTVFSAGALLGSLAYPAYCRRFPPGQLVHAAIATGVITNLVYLTIVDETSGQVAAFVSGFAYMTGTMIQLDIAARRAPLVAAATVFACLMALSNLAASISEACGGWLYEALLPTQTAAGAYFWVVIVSAAAPALCWTLVPWLKRELPAWFEAARHD